MGFPQRSGHGPRWAAKIKREWMHTTGMLTLAFPHATSATPPIPCAAISRSRPRARTGGGARALGLPDHHAHLWASPIALLDVRSAGRTCSLSTRCFTTAEERQMLSKVARATALRRPRVARASRPASSVRSAAGRVKVSISIDHTGSFLGDCAGACASLCAARKYRIGRNCRMIDRNADLERRPAATPPTG